jgi:uncharacterized protein (TIGR01777 family)
MEMVKSMRILITGATGLIGRELGKRLASRGHDIVVTSRNAERARRDLPFPARVFTWPGSEEPFPVTALEGVEAVVNLAGESIGELRWTEVKKNAIRTSRVLGTRNLVESLKQLPQPIRVLVQGSAMGYYGDRGDESLTEAAVGGQGFLADVVRDWETEAEELTATGARVVKVRTGVVFARHGGVFQKLAAIFGKGLGGRLGSGRQWMSWIHLEDIVNAFIFCLENEALRGAVNAVAPEPVRNERFTVAFARAIDRPVFLPVPLPALQMALGDSVDMVLSSSRVVPQALVDAGFQFAFPELALALKDLCEPLRNGQHEFIVEQWVPRPPEDVFPFFSDEKNLEVLTPAFLHFKVLDKSTATLESGTVIDYLLTLHGVPLRWRSKIVNWSEGKSFVDVQERGPYQKWHHTHEFVPFAGGTLLRDRVLYRLPFGLVGETVAGWKVDREVTEIFAFRRKLIAERFGTLES